jgi:prefoldin subunit 5
MRFSTMIKQIEKRRDAIGKERDKLNEMISEMETLRDCCERAWDDLQTARDALSEHA